MAYASFPLNVNPARRRWGLGLLLAYALVVGPLCVSGGSSSDLRFGEVDQLIEGGVSLSEGSISVWQRDGVLQMSVQISQTDAVARTGTLRVDLLDPLQGEEYRRVGQGEISLSESGAETFTINLDGLTMVPTDDELAGMILRLRVELPGVVLRSRRSLVKAWRRPKVRVVGSDKVYQGDTAQLRVLATDRATGAPAAQAQVTITATQDTATYTVYTGTTDDFGQLEASLNLDALGLGAAELEIEVDSDVGSEKVNASLQLISEHRILLTTDKPLYQPEQTIHLRALSLGYPHLLPHANTQSTFEIFDAKGNKVGKEVTQTNAHGIASTTFKVARVVNLGAWRIRATVGTSVQEKTITVSRYALPKYRVTVNAQEPYYRPGQQLNGTVRAEYFFGEKVAGAQVTVKAHTFDAGFNQFAEQIGTTDAQGAYTFSMSLPGMIPGLPLEQGGAFVYLEVSVLDTASHQERGAATVLIAGEDVLVQLIPEANQVAAGVENVFYVVTTDPVGAPLACSVTVEDSQSDIATVPTDDNGLGELRFTPTSATLSLVAHADCPGLGTVHKTASFQAGLGSEMEGLLVRTDEPLYAGGESVQVSLLAPRAEDRVYLDVISHNRTVSSQTLTVSGGEASTTLDLTPDLAGALQLRVYYLSSDGQIVRNQRLIYVEDSAGLSLTITPGQDPYLPGELATVSFQVTDSGGVGVGAAIGVNVVDEAVFALTEFKPGLEKTYFKLEQELLTPRYQIKNCSMQDVTGGAGDPDSRARAEVYLAASGGEVKFPIDVESPDQLALGGQVAASQMVAADMDSVLSRLANGKARTEDQVLEPGVPEMTQVAYPTGVVPGANELLVKIYPGLMSQVVEGLDAMLKVPYG